MPLQTLEDQNKVKTTSQLERTKIMCGRWTWWENTSRKEIPKGVEPKETLESKLLKMKVGETILLALLTCRISLIRV